MVLKLEQLFSFAAVAAVSHCGWCEINEYGTGQIRALNVHVVIRFYMMQVAATLNCFRPHKFTVIFS